MSYTTPQSTGAPNGAPHELQQPDLVHSQPNDVAPPQYGSEFNNEKALPNPQPQGIPQDPNQIPMNYQSHPPQQQQQGAYQMATPLGALQQGSAPVDCPVCGKRELTRVEYVSGGTTHGVAALLCFCFCLGCIPYLATWFKDAEHKCGSCGTMLAVWHRSGRTEVLAHRK